MTDVAVVAELNMLLGESPIWSVDEQALYWVDIRNPMIYRLDPASGERTEWPVETEIGSIGFAKDGRLVCGTRMGFGFFDLKEGKLEIVEDPEGDGRLNRSRFNDGKTDRRGRYWSGTMQDPGQAAVGNLYRIETDNSITKVEGDIQVPNAICWSPDGDTMYFADSRKNTIWAHDYDQDAGEMSNRRVFVDLGDSKIHPDGATVDAEGFLWCAEIYGGRVARYDPDGKLERAVEFPVPLVTCPCFGGPNLTTLYATTATIRMTDAEIAAQPLAGAVFAADVGIKGLPEPTFG